MKKKKSKSVISFLTGLILFALALYLIYYLTQIVDFTTTKVIINDDVNLWKFLSFVPLLVLLFNAAIAIINGILGLKTLNVLVIVINIILMVFIKYDLYGVITVVQKYNSAMNFLFTILIITSLIMIVDIILNIVSNKEKNKKEVYETVEMENEPYETSAN